VPELPDTASVADGKTYTILPNPNAAGGYQITCRICHLTSAHPRDVAEKYCGRCQIFHDALTPEQLILKLQDQLDEVRHRNDTQANTITYLAQQARDLHGRISAMQGGIAKEAHDVEQALGQALGYPWYKDDQKNFPGATERDGVCVGAHTPASIAEEAAQMITRLTSERQDLAEENGKLWKSVQGGDVLIVRYRRLLAEARPWVEDYDEWLDPADPVGDDANFWLEEVDRELSIPFTVNDAEATPGS